MITITLGSLLAAVMAAGLALLCASCQKEPDGAVATRPSQPAATAAAEPPPEAREYIAEDPRLSHLIGKPGPDVTLQALDGTLIDVASNYGNKPVYLKLWASYCIPCRAQMPKFEKIYESVGDRMQVIAVNAGVGDDAAKVKAFVAKTGIHMPIAIDDGSLGAWLEMQETPVHLLMGRDGRIAFAGHQDGAQLDAAIERVLRSPPPGERVKPRAVDRLPAIGIGDHVPALALTGPDGASVPLSRAAKRRPHALFFTATWCEDYLKDIEPQTAARCARARNEVAKLAQSDSVEWSGVASHLWTTPEDLKQYLAQTRQTLPFAVDTDGGAFRMFGIRRFPAIALIDAQGRLSRVIGPDEQDDLAQAVAALGRRE